MLAKIRTRITKELSHYHTLTVDARRLLLSFYLFLLAYPLFDIFINAFIWRQKQDITQLVIYNIANCLGILVCFYLNGLLLRYFHSTKLYILGLIFQALSTTLVVFSATASGLTLGFFGLLYGFGVGFFWANKNYLSLILTRGSNRLYYNSLEASVLLIIRITVPVIAGLIISFGTRSGLYSTQFAYQGLMVLGAILILCSCLIIYSSSIADIAPEKLSVTASPRWNYVRMYNFLYNIINGAEYIVPPILILTMLGKEGTLGIIVSASSALSAATLYLLARKGNISQVGRVVAIGNTIYFMGTLLLLIFFSPLFSLIYLAGYTIGRSLRHPLPYTVTMEIMDRESSAGQYAYLCDDEIFFNSGRILGMILVFAISIESQSLALRATPIFLGLVSILSLYPLHQMVKSIRAK